MSVRASALGLEAGESAIEVSARDTMAYAAGIGAQSAYYLDDLCAGGIVAPPAFCVALEWHVVNGARLREITGTTAEETWGGIHVQQDSTFHRPVKPADRLHVAGRVTQMRQTGAGALVVIRLDTRRVDGGALVVTSWFSMILLKLQLDGPGGTVDVAPALRAEPALTVPSSGRVTIPTPATLAHIYTECSRIWNPIHTERRVALSRGLPDIILHGTCTWAIASETLIRLCAGGDPLRLRRLAGRFHGMVIPGQSIEIEYGAADPGRWQFVVRNARGKLAVSHGEAQFDAA
jgi:acyl dehydratase